MAEEEKEKHLYCFVAISFDKKKNKLQTLNICLYIEEDEVEGRAKEVFLLDKSVESIVVYVKLSREEKWIGFITYSRDNFRGGEIDRAIGDREREDIMKELNLVKISKEEEYYPTRMELKEPEEIEKYEEPELPPMYVGISKVETEEISAEKERELLRKRVMEKMPRVKFEGIYFKKKGKK